SSRRRHTRSDRDWSSDVCSSDLRFVQRSTAVQVLVMKNGHDSRLVGLNALAKPPLFVVETVTRTCPSQLSMPMTSTTVCGTSSKIGRASCRERVEIQEVEIRGRR